MSDPSVSDPSVERDRPDAGTTSADRPGEEASPASGALPDPDLESPGAAGRAEPGVPPPPDTNQPDVEPVPPQGDRVDAVPASTGGGRGRGAVGTSTAADAVPSGSGATAPAGSGSPQHLSGTVPSEDRPEVDADAATSGAGDAVETPRSGGAGRSSRTPGDLGTPPQPFEADVAAGAARTAPGSPPQSTPPAADAPGDAHGVSVNDTHAMAGTSEQSSVVHGVRTPVSPDGGAAPGASPGGGAPGRTAASAGDDRRTGGTPGGGSTAAGGAGSLAGSTSGASATASVPASDGVPDPAAQPQALVDTDAAGPAERTGTLTGGESDHATKDSGPAAGRGAITGRRSSPDGEVGAG